MMPELAAHIKYFAIAKIQARLSIYEGDRVDKRFDRAIEIVFQATSLRSKYSNNQTNNLTDDLI